MANDWTKSNTVLIRFEDIPTGEQFAYASSGAISLKRNVFTKVEPYTASAPNATSAESAKLKLWFEPQALVRLQKPASFDDQHMQMIAEAREAAYQAEKKISAHKRFPDNYSIRYSAPRCSNCNALSGDHDMRVCGGKSADRAEARIVASLLQAHAAAWAEVS